MTHYLTPELSGSKDIENIELAAMLKGVELGKEYLEWWSAILLCIEMDKKLWVKLLFTSHAQRFEYWYTNIKSKHI